MHFCYVLRTDFFFTLNKIQKKNRLKEYSALFNVYPTNLLLTVVIVWKKRKKDLNTQKNVTVLFCSFVVRQKNFIYFFNNIFPKELQLQENIKIYFLGWDTSCQKIRFVVAKMWQKYHTLHFFLPFISKKLSLCIICFSCWCKYEIFVEKISFNKLRKIQLKFFFF